MGFYSLDYEYWKGGKERVRRSFNPDFFIQISIRDFLLVNAHTQQNAVAPFRYLQEEGIENIILVVEIKSDDDDSEATVAKEQFGKDHFKSLNSRLREANPIDFPEQFRDSVNQLYIFYVLRPAEFPSWFGKLQNRTDKSWSVTDSFLPS